MREWGTALLCAAVPVFVAGCAAWVFPAAATASVGAWALPALSLVGLVLALALAAEWPLLRALLLVLAIVLVASWNRASATSTSHFAGACLGCLLMVGIGRWASTPLRLRLALLAFLWGGVFVVLVGLTGAIHLPGRFSNTGPSSMLPAIQLGLAGLGPQGEVNANALASAVLLVLPLGASVLLFGGRRRLDWWTVLPAAIVVVAVGTATLALTRSQTALVAVWLVALGSLVRGMRSPWQRAIAGTLVVAPLVIWTGGLAALTQEEAHVKAKNAWVSVQSRTQIMNQALNTWKQSPWMGIGLNEFRHVYASRPGDIPVDEDIAHAHNVFLQTLLDIGVVGAVAYWSVLALLGLRAHQATRGVSTIARTAATGAALALLAVHLFGLADAVALGSKVGTLQWAAGGVILAAWHVRTIPTDGDIVAAAPDTGTSHQ